MPIGFVGLGVMGHPMAGHLAAAGHEMRVYDLDDGAKARFHQVHPAADAVDTAGAAGEGASVVITMLPDGHQVAAVAAELAKTMPAGSVLLDSSSAQPWLTLDTAAMLAGHEISMVDAPVSGAEWGAQAAELVFMVGGSADDVATVRPVLDVLGRAVHHVGPLGSGHVMKCINNTITAMTFLATSEGLALGAKAGLDPATINTVLNESTGASWITANHIGARILTRTFDDPFKLDLMAKDVAIATQLARDLQVPLPFSTLGDGLYQLARQWAGPGVSLSELAHWVETTAGAEIAPRTPSDIGSAEAADGAGAGAGPEGNRV